MAKTCDKAKRRDEVILRATQCQATTMTYFYCPIRRRINALFEVVSRLDGTNYLVMLLVKRAVRQSIRLLV